MSTRHHKQWTEAERRTLRAQYPDTPTRALAAALGRTEHAVGMMAVKLGLQKTAAFLASPHSGRLLPGNTPANKGRHHPARGGTLQTVFQPGNKPVNTKPVGSYRINADGHLQRKVSERSGNNSQRWRTVAELVWVDAHGPLPPKHIVVFKPGQKTAVLEQITLDKVECISMAENARRNHPKHRSPELAKLVQLKSAIARQNNRIQRYARKHLAHENHA